MTTASIPSAASSTSGATGNVGIVALGIMGLAIMGLVLWLSHRGGTKSSGDGLAGWGQWRHSLGYKKSVRRARQRIPQPDVPDTELSVFFAYPAGTTKKAQRLFLQLEDSILVNGPARSGKTRYVAERLVGDATGSVIATSTKIDLLLKTLSTRQRCGQVWVYDPMGLLPAHTPGVRRLRWDPVRGCEDPETALRRGSAWAGAQPMNGVKNGDWFNRRGAAVLSKLLHAAALDGRDILDVKRWGTDLGDDTPQAILKERGPRGWREDLQALAGNKAQETVGSISISLAAILECLDSPRAVETVTPSWGEHFNVEQFLSGSNTLYLLASEDAGPTVAPLFTMLVDELIYTAAQLSQRSPGGFLWPPMRFVGDEIAQLAPIAKLPAYMADSGGRGLQLVPIVQSFAQLRNRWGDDGADAIIATASTKLYLPGNSEEKVAAHLIRLAGRHTVKTYSGSRQAGGTGRADSTSASWSTTKEDKLTATAIRELPMGHAWMEYRSLPIGKIRLPEWTPTDAPVPPTTPPELQQGWQSGWTSSDTTQPLPVDASAGGRSL